MKSTELSASHAGRQMFILDLASQGAPEESCTDLITFGERERSHVPIFIDAWAHAMNRRLSCPEPVLLGVGKVILQFQPLGALDVHHEITVWVTIQARVNG
jgi:hypothetical protein